MKVVTKNNNTSISKDMGPVIENRYRNSDNLYETILLIRLNLSQIINQHYYI
jgi:hypothetical protein